MSSNPDIQNPVHKPRDRWNTRVAFILACIGSAVGIGNFWRFPYLTFKWGGAIFFIPYLISLIFFGIPMMIFETGVGQKFQKGDIGVFGNINKRIYGIGLASVYGSLVILFYYIVIIAWAVYYFIASFFDLYWAKESPWQDECKGHSAAETFFFKQVIKHWDDNCEAKSENNVEAFAWEVYLCTLLCWVFCFISCMKGAKSMSWIVYVTVPLPVILLLIMLVRVVQLEGAGKGIEQYILGGDESEGVSILTSKGEIWAEAAGQIFFSLSVCMGVMTSYGSFNDVKAPVIGPSLIISLTNSCVSFVSGFVVWSVIGYLQATNNPVSKNNSSIGLAFIAYPTATSELTGATFWALLLFSVIFLLGIDSAFSLLEAASTVIHDQIGHKVSRPIIVGVISVFGAAISAIYCMDNGLKVFDVIDHYLNTYVMILIGVFECIGVGWFYNIDNLFRKIGHASTYTAYIGYWASCVVGVFLAFFVFFDSGLLWLGMLIQLVGWIITWVVSYILCNKHDSSVSFGTWLDGICFEGAQPIADHILSRSFMKTDGKATGCWGKTQGKFFQWMWCLNIKFSLPTVLSWIACWSLRTDIFIGYGNYELWLNWIGIVVVIVGFLCIIIPGFFPYKEDQYKATRKLSPVHVKGQPQGQYQQGQMAQHPTKEKLESAGKLKS